MDDQECPHMGHCEMYSLLKLSGTLKAWQNRYCCASFSDCARFRLSAEGRRVPINLMPNGAYLRSNNKP